MRRVPARGPGPESSLPRLPVAYLSLGLVPGAAVALLDLADQLVAVARHLVELVVGELAPLRLHLALHLLPVAFDDVPVHVRSCLWKLQALEQNLCRQAGDDASLHRAQPALALQRSRQPLLGALALVDVEAHAGVAGERAAVGIARRGALEHPAV